MNDDPTIHPDNWFGVFESMNEERLSSLRAELVALKELFSRRVEQIDQHLGRLLS